MAFFKKSKVKYESKEDEEAIKKIDEFERAISALHGAGQQVPESMSKQLADLKAALSPNKLKAKKIFYNGIEYDSTREAKFARKLNDSGLLYDYQVEVTLMEALELDDEKVRPIHIVVDFLVMSEYFVDVKGITTQHFDDKWKLLKNKFQDSKKYIIVKKESDFDTVISRIRTKGWQKIDTLSL